MDNGPGGPVFRVFIECAKSHFICEIAHMKICMLCSLRNKTKLLAVLFHIASILPVVICNIM